LSITWFTKNKNVILYVFGKTLRCSTHKLKAARPCLRVQILKEFSGNCLDPLMGEQTAKGRLPVSISLKKNNDYGK